MTRIASVLNGVRDLGAHLVSAIELAQTRDDQPFIRISSMYDRYESYYANAVYTQENGRWHEGMPANIRPIVAVAKPAIDWWTANLYPGVWTDDGLPSSSGVRNRLSYGVRTAPDLRIATQQAFRWGRWDGPSLLAYCFNGSLLGDAFAYVEVDWDRNVVYPRRIHPRNIYDIEWDNSGNVTMFHIRMNRHDGDKRYVWGMRVDKDTISTYYNDDIFGYGDMPGEIDNPWGFVPAVWTQHRNVGGDHGSGVLDGLLPLIDELNGMQSAVDDFIEKFIHQKVVVSSDDSEGLANLLEMAINSSEGLTDDGDNGMYESLIRRYSRSRRNHDDEIDIFPAPPGVTVNRLLANLGLADSAVHFDRVSKFIEQNLPELILSEKLLGMAMVSEPGVRSLVQNVQYKLNDVSANYDSDIVKLAQMCCSIGGHLVNNGHWGPPSMLTDQQKKFIPFDLESYHKGQLDFHLLQRELLPSTITERANEVILTEQAQTVWGFRHIGLTDQEIFGKEKPTDTGVLEELKLGKFKPPPPTFGGLPQGGDVVQPPKTPADNQPAPDGSPPPKPEPPR